MTDSLLSNINPTNWFNPDYWLTRFIFLRGLGVIYFIAFLSAWNQYRGLIGKRGLLPAKTFLQNFKHKFGKKAYLKLPTLFWINVSDFSLGIACISGITLSIFLILGPSSGVMLLLLWILYLSIVHVGQIFYGYGWESMLLEIGFISIFFVPFLNFTFFPANYPPSKIIVFLLIWVLFRTMLGAGLIKIRGDRSWKDLTALFYHFETQPIPNPFSRFLHHLPKPILKCGVIVNHIVELFIPFLLLGPSTYRLVGGLLTALFQFTLIVSGNLSWLNWLTILVCIPCIDDSIWLQVVPKGITSQIPSTIHPYAPHQEYILLGLFIVVAILSIKPILNLFSAQQSMNRSYNPFHIVNTYGAFGSIGTTRNEIVIKGTSDEIITPETKWEEYEFKAKPGNPNRRPPIISPYHYRLDWQIWFAAMSDYTQNSWLVHLVYKLLNHEKQILKLIYKNPFKDKPPKHIKVDLYRYEFSKDKKSWWGRKYLLEYLMPLNLKNKNLLSFIKHNEWI